MRYAPGFLLLVMVLLVAGAGCTGTEAHVRPEIR